MNPAAALPRAPRAGLAAGLAWAAIVALYVAPRLSLSHMPLDRDEGAFGVVAQALWRGELPYRDVFDHKPPGVFYVYALALACVPPTAGGVHGFLHVWNFGTLLLVVALARRLGGARAGWLAGAVYAATSASCGVQGFTASTEMLMLLPLAGSAYLALLATEREGRARAWRLAWSGFLGAAACWIKQPAAASLLLVPCLLAAAHGRAQAKAALADFGVWLLGGLAASVLVCAPFVLAGAAGELFYWSFTHSLVYGSLVGGGTWAQIAKQLLYPLMDLGAPALLGALGCGWLFLRGQESRAWIPPAWLGLSLLGALHTTQLYPHYFAQLLPATALAAGWGLDGLARALKVRPARLGLAGVVSAALALAPSLILNLEYWTAPPALVSLNLLGPQGFEATPLVAQYLRERTEPEDSIFIYGSEPQVAFAAERRLANPYVMLYPLTLPFPRQREFQERVWEGLARDPPAYILVQINNSRSTLQGPATDPFLGTRLNELTRARYEMESVLLIHPELGYRFVSGLDDQRLNELRTFTHFLMLKRLNASDASAHEPPAP
ncbi:MAG: glycosyltransferase family 39 protein [Planctomycetota bacterium]|nr:glycosyltransferase family 39 protein [Planctomycetota bacterium]